MIRWHAPRKLHETVTAENWRQGSYGWDTDRLCLGAHIREAYGLTGLNDRVGPLVVEAIMTLYPDRVDCFATQFALLPISAFNDHADTTVEDVVRVLKLVDA